MHKASALFAFSAVSPNSPALLHMVLGGTVGVGIRRRFGYLMAGSSMNTANRIRPFLATRILGLSALLPACGLLVQSAGAAVVSIEDGAWARLSQLRIEISPAGLRSLRNEPRTRVSASWHDGSVVITSIVVRVKGHVGSFRSVDEDRKSVV